MLLQMEKLLPGYLQQVIMQRKKIALENAGVKVFVTSREKHINLHKMLDVLGQKGVSSLLIEGGGEVNASFIENKLMDKLILYVAPKIIGGRLAPSFVEGLVLLKCKMQLNLRMYHLPRLEKIIDLLAIRISENIRRIKATYMFR